MNSRKKKINIKATIIILLSSITLALIYNAFSSDGIDWIRKPLLVQTINNIDDNGNTGNLLGVNLQTSIEVYEDGNAIFIDARDQWEYSEGHIKGAINIPEFSFDKSNQELKSINKSSLLIVYCDGDDCDISKRLTAKLINLGYRNAYVFLGGFKSWKEANLPISEGKNNE